MFRKTLEFEILDEDDIIARVYVNFDTREVDVEQYDDFILRRPFWKEPVTVEDVINFFKRRCFPRTRHNCEQLLRDLGLSYYDPIAIVQKTHGLMFDDYIWVRFKGENISYDDIKIRD